MNRKQMMNYNNNYGEREDEIFISAEIPESLWTRVGCFVIKSKTTKKQVIFDALNAWMDLKDKE